MTTTEHGYPICPKCGHFIPNDNEPGAYPGALSRRDNETYICSACGTDEAMEDFAKYLDSQKGKK